MVEGSADESQIRLLNTPTWAIAATCSVFILSSLIVERTVFSIGYVCKKYKQTALHEAFEKIKEELMLVGFISLALTLGQRPFSNICVPAKWTTVMLYCKKSPSPAETKHFQLPPIRRNLASGTPTPCKAGKAHFISLESLHQLHILIFILAVVHISYSFMTVGLGMWKVHNWKAWEDSAKNLSTRTHGQRFARETTFVQKRATGKWNTNPFLAYVAAFFQQFHKSVSETDYHTLRHGFIKSHMPANVDFDFHKYMIRTLQEDFEHVVGISPGLWGYAVLVMLLNIDGWEMRTWASLIPLILVLIIGTKLQRIITKMAVQIIEKHIIVAGIPDVKPSDELFWFGHPRLVLSCIHFILFQNALEMSIHIWSAVSLGTTDNCLHGKKYLFILRLIFGIVAQMICGYVTLPIYALVSQMGSSIKKTIFEDHIQLAIKKWHRQAKAGEGRAHQGEHQSSSSAEDHLEAQNAAASTTTHKDSIDDSYNYDDKIYLERVGIQRGGEIQGPVYHFLPK